jgi:hypothetical protein
MFKHIDDKQYMKEAREAFHNDTCTQEQKMHYYEYIDRRKALIQKTLESFWNICCRHEYDLEQIMTITIALIKHSTDIYYGKIMKDNPNQEIRSEEKIFLERIKADLIKYFDEKIAVLTL